MQFEIAWEIKSDMSGMKNSHDWEVLLEYLSITMTIGGKTKRFYTDIIVFNNITGEFIPIELKYKTERFSQVGVEILKHHGAQDLGSYDFWWDVKRIEILKAGMETLTNRKCEKIDYIKESDYKTCLRGYSVFVTNDGSYLRGHNSCGAAFYPVNGKTFPARSVLDWNGARAGSFYKNSWRATPIPLNNTYTSNWVSGIVAPHNVKFNYLVLEI